ncbi:hypothetical protein GTA51_03875 [Desulfovibrio aerotolerans]|uniref:Uncharacterized protein n=1 Tax=Solidesulfovibrio aerotolerans TaxID=295255 RepID=A0A7C9NI54_9BACT|nr:hypothetical protein [Solidesulfovibrio aerotolerans]MYL82276.1 hypothetical protein [Solidesulfovibrio aerotolerans]
MLQHLPAAGEAGDSQSLAADLAAQNEHFLYLRQLLQDIESVFGRLSSSLATLHVGVEELAREKKAMPIREKKAVPSAKPASSRPVPA